MVQRSGQVRVGRWKRDLQKPDPDLVTYFTFFNEIGIIGQLSGTLFQKKLPEGFLVSHFSVLNHLVRLGDAKTPLSIARAFQVPKTTMTHTLSGLEKAGMIRFAPNPQDGRSKCVMLTEAGREFRQQAIASLAPEIAELAKTLPAERIASILPVLQEVRTLMDKARDG